MISCKLHRFSGSLHGQENNHHKICIPLLQLDFRSLETNALQKWEDVIISLLHKNVIKNGYLYKHIN